MGVSTDDIKTLTEFQKKQEAPQRFVSDPEQAAIKAYGVEFNEGSEKYAKRQTFVIGREGKILYSVFDWSPLSNVNKVYEWLKAHPQA